MNKNGKISFDKSNFRSYFDQYFKALVGFANKFLSDIDMSEDLVQEVFVKLWEKHDEYENETTLKVYLYRSVRNNCLNQLKKQKVRQDYQTESLPQLDTEEFFLDQVLSEEVSRMLYRSISELPEKRQQIVRYSLQGLKNQEIADMMGSTINTVKSQKMYAYKELREKLGKHAFLIALLLDINI